MLPDAIRCPKCVETIKAMGHKSPVGYEPFAWSPSTEIPEHFYVSTEDQADVEGEIAVVKICEIQDPTARERK